MTNATSTSTSRAALAELRRAAFAEHGRQLGGPTHYALLHFTTADGEPVPCIASRAIPTDGSGWADADTYGSAWEACDDHAEAIYAAANAEEVTATLRSRREELTLAIIDYASAELGPQLIRCERCEAIEHEVSAATVETRHGPETWCDSCTDEHSQRCDDCSGQFALELMHSTGSNSDICHECIESYYTCDDCGELHHSENIHSVDDGDQSVCSGCLDHGEGSQYFYDRNAGGWYTEAPDDDDDDEHQGDAMTQYSYHSDPHDRLDIEPLDTGAAYGFELEHLGRPDNWPAVKAACKGRAIYTQDGSVAGEFVSLAMGAGEIRQALSELARSLTGTRNDANTGLHIHADRRHLNPWQWHRLAHYCRQQAATLAVVSGRSGGTYQCWARLQASTWEEWAELWKCGGNESNRYVGLRVTRKTVEFRCNRATKAPHRALARFGLIQRLIALGRLPDSAKPNTEQLKGWLAQDAQIRQVTGWQPGNWNYSQASKLQPQTVEEMPPWQRPGAAQRAAILRLQVEANRRTVARLRDEADILWEQRIRTERNTPARLTAASRERMNQYVTIETSRQYEEARRQLEQLQPMA